MEFEFPYTIHSVTKCYVNRAARLMENFYSDLLIDVAQIKNMPSDSVLYFIIQPNCTHSAAESQYDEISDICGRTWGNYVVIRIEHKENDKYYIKNWDVFDKKSYDTKSQDLIKKYEEFALSRIFLEKYC